MHLFRRQGRAAPAGTQCVQLLTVVPERRSMSLSSSSSEVGFRFQDLGLRMRVRAELNHIFHLTASSGDPRPER